MNKIIAALAVIVVIAGFCVFGVPAYQRSRAGAQIQSVREFCESYRPGDLFVENEFNIRAGARGLPPFRSEAMKATGSATDGEFAAEIAISGNTDFVRRCLVRATAGRVVETRLLELSAQAAAVEKK